MTHAQILEALVAAALKCGIILGVAGIVATLSWRASASFRHLVWTLGVSSALAMPALGVLLPNWSTPIADAVVWTKVRLEPNEPADPQSVGPAQDYATSEAISGENAAAAGPGATSPLGALTEVIEPPNTLEAHSQLPPSQPGVAPQSVVTGDWGIVLLAVWMLGAAVALIPLLAGIVRVRLLSRASRRVLRGPLTEAIQRLQRTSSAARRVTLVESDNAAMPMTWGIVSPMLLVPADAERWSESRCRNILLHELAHVERRDCLTQLVAQLACAVYWFNPLVWIAAHRMRVEREFACDDRVLCAGSAASDYAANLLDVARSLHAPFFTSQTAIAMARPSQIFGRLLAVLDPTRNRSRIARPLGTFLAAGALAVVIPLASIAPGAEAATSPTAEMPIATTVHVVAGAVPAATKLPTAIVRAVHVPDVALIVPRVPPLGSTATVPAASFITVATGPMPTGNSKQGLSCWEEKTKGSSNTSISNNDNDGGRQSWTVRFSNGDCSLEVRAEGRFALRSDLSDIESLDGDGWFRMEERIGRDSRRVEIRRVGGGALEHIYHVNGDRRAFDTDGRNWMARTLLLVERRTAFTASTRVPRLYREGGLRSVLNEIALMSSPYPKASYYKALLAISGSNINASTLNAVASQAATELAASDHYLTEVLGKLAAHPSANESTWRTFADAAGRMSSDYYKAATLSRVLKRGTVGNETVRTLLRSASTIKSDHYLAEVLKSVAAGYAVSADTRQYYVDAIRNIESDYYRRQVLATLSSSGEWDSRTSAAVLTSVGEIRSDYEKSQSLITLAREGRIENWMAYLAAASTINSSYYQRQTLEAVLKLRPLTREMVAGVLSVAPKIASDSDLGGLLASVTKNYRIDESLRPAYEKAADAISSDYYRGSALVALRKSMDR